MTSLITDPKSFLTDLFQTAVAAADPMKVVAPHLPSKPDGRLLVIGAGKASARMAEAVEAHYGPCEGFVITRYGYGRDCEGIEIVEASHPVPDQAGLNATMTLLERVRDLSADDVVVALISGGGSALLCAPADGLTLEDKIDLNARLLASGAPIGDMNVLRKFVSSVKGGKLAAACHPARLITLLISDVPGDDPALIASGPTVGAKHSAQEAVALLDRWIPDAPDHWRNAVAAGSVVAPDDPSLARAETYTIAAPSGSLAIAAEQARSAGITVQMLGDNLEGEARDLAAEHATRALEIQHTLTAQDAPVLLMSGGECTVTRRGDGSGGPNAEYTLAAAVALNGAPGIHVLACDTDGVDGAAEIAGAYAGPQTLSKGADAVAALAINDAHGLFQSIGDSIVTGPTLTNVNDFRAILIQPQPDGIED
ncbi:glycerate kinase type-2 family protein [Pontivivens insulae]|uniref:Hydroxypyruvate reductase n=1 Tax=Pontivivens insulae TaxID=1639689 RepID=A0A2R8A6V6_9RHOB|nr:glycerate kinase [Pontivivens insulae]RED18086.1 hydroxypyruvate reductase [Pontivivens insulae]SPF27983.1 Putative hydroxypyruvate reductase [Pontivivens insulae]